MLRAYVRKLRDRYVGAVENALSPHTPDRAWLADACAASGLIPVDGHRNAMLTVIASRMRPVRERLAAWLEGRDDGTGVAAALLAAASAVDDGNVWHTGSKLRSYVDVSVQAKALRILIDDVCEIARSTMPIDALELCEILVEHSSSSRAALIVHAELLLDRGDADAALESVQQALRVQAVCTTAQHLLFRAYAMKKAQGSTDPALDVLDYDLSDKFCKVPFTHLSTGFRGSSYLCACPAWVPFSVGDIGVAASAEALWNSDAAIEIRRSILDGDFSYCSRTLCSFLTTKKLPRRSEITTPALREVIERRLTRLDDILPTMVELNHDPACNLSCPSCRTEIVVAKSDEADLYSRATQRVILPLLRRVQGSAYITGGGEAFASAHFRSILGALNRDEYPGLQVLLITNGQWITPRRWRAFPALPEMIGILYVSIDAARAETYEKLRRPGKWSSLMRNLEFISAMRKRGEVRQLGINFVVQRDNFREILEFIALGDSIGADMVWLQRVVNYGAYDEATFAQVDVSSPAHPDHQELLAILRHPTLSRPTINMQMLQGLLPEFIASDEQLPFLL